MSDEEPKSRRVLLDEMLPKVLAREFPSHRVRTTAQEGWKGIKNGELLRLAEAAGVEVFITADRNLEHQQRLTGRAFGVVVISIGSTNIEDLSAVGGSLRAAVDEIAAGEIIHVAR